MAATTELAGHRVHRLGFGAMQLAGPGVLGPPKDPDAARAVLRRAVELGVDHIDTAQYYGPDVVNGLLAETLHPYPDGLQLVSKVGARRNAGGAWLPAQQPEQLREDVLANLRALRVERIAAVNLRLMPPGRGPQVPLEDQLGALEDLRREGAIDGIGISNVDVDRLRLAMSLVDLVEVQNAYSVVDREDEPLLDLAREHGVPFVPFFPLGSAFGGGPAALAADPAIAEVAAQHGATASQIALAWLLQRYDRMLLIPGTSSVAHLEENVAAADIELSEEDLSRLDEVRPVGRPHT
jgi:aryl-alcohol dehydrogenase-like predicted oxidoreductase